MYIRHLGVGHLKRFREFEIDFTHNGKPRMWTVLIGENGTAKTTLLQAIALAAAGSKHVNELAGGSVKYLRDRRSEREEMEIHATFDFSPHSLKMGTPIFPDLPPHADRKHLQLRSHVSLAPKSTAMDASSEYSWPDRSIFAGMGESGAGRSKRRDPLDLARNQNFPLWFVAGYGVSRVLPDASFSPPLARPALERLQPLFGGPGLVGTAFANHFLQKDVEEGKSRGTTSRKFAKLLNEAIKLGGFDLFPDLEKLELRGQGGTSTSRTLIEADRFYQHINGSGRAPVAIAGVALSHGYQSTFAWISDLIGHILLEAKTPVRTVEMEGLVLLDEIDLYLHPTWQALFVRALRRVFPKMQFVATTHSPVVLSELAPHEVVRLIVDGESGDVVQAGWDSATGKLAPLTVSSSSQPDPRLMTGSELYRTWFSLDRLTPNPVGEDLRRLKVLDEDPERTPAQNAELKGLREKLEKRLGSETLTDFVTSSRVNEK
jgi:hypothetical protein